jgi:hypothetical protein
MPALAEIEGGGRALASFLAGDRRGRRRAGHAGAPEEKEDVMGVRLGRLQRGSPGDDLAYKVAERFPSARVLGAGGDDVVIKMQRCRLSMVQNT